MRLVKSLHISIAMALALTMSVSGVAYAAAPTIVAQAAGKIEGSGATFPWSQYTKWFTNFTALNNEVTTVVRGTSTKQFHASNATNSLVLGYSGGGSGAGISNFSGVNKKISTQMFSGTDSVLSATERTTIDAALGAGKYSVIPMISGPISLAYNVPGLVTSANRAATLRLDGEAVCGIYLGTIKTWNDAKIRTLNPTIANLPSATIKVVGRSDSSGTTFIFSSYLAKAATVAQKNCGYHSNFSSGEANLDDAVGTFKPAKTVPADQFSGIRSTNGAAAITSPGNSNQLLASHIKASANVYSIGYVESSYVTSTAADAGITGSIQGAVLAAQTLNAGKQVFLSPTTTTVSSALTNAKITEDPINPSSSFVQPVFATGINSYPIVGYSWIMFYHEYTNATVTTGQVQGLIVFLNWALTTGQAATHMYTGYNPLIASVRTTAILELKKIKFDGTLLWP